MTTSRYSTDAAGSIIPGTPDDDFLNGTPDDDALLGYAGNDVLHGQAGADTLWGHEGQDVLYGENGNDLLMGGEDGDRLYGGNHHDILIGDAGDDSLYGENGDDTLDGSTGNDYLTGGNGNDTYIFGVGGGQDTIFNDNFNYGTDWLMLGSGGAGLNTGDVTLSRKGDTLTVSINGTSDRISVNNHFFNSAETLSYIEFADGTRWYWNDILANVVATEDDDTLVGTIDDDVMNGLGGNDELFGYYGNDTLDGGTGNDSLAGNFGDDTYLFNIGSGQDTISNREDAAGTEKVVLGAGITTDDVTLRRTGEDLVVHINGTDDQFTVRYQFASDYASIETLEFADGTIWDTGDMEENVEITKWDDTVHGTAGNDVINGLAGNDDLLGFAGNDTLIGGLGNDNLFGYDGDNLLYGGNGTDSLYAGSGNDLLSGGSGDDLMSGSGGNDVFNGGAGNDWYLGGDGDDKYQFGLGSDFDRIDNGDTAGGHDRILMGPGITADDVTLTANVYDMILSINGSTDQLTVNYYFFGGGNAVDSIKFEDGTIWGAAKIAAEMFTGDAGKDVINGSYADDTLRGFAGNDILYGHLGNDTLHGGLGKDTLYSGGGADAFVFDTALNASTNVDTIKRFSETEDAIHLDNAIFTQLGAAGALNADFFATNVSGTAQDANDYIVYNSDTGQLFYDADGSGAGAKVEFALVGTHVRVALTAGDFQVL